MKVIHIPKKYPSIMYRHLFYIFFKFCELTVTVEAQATLVLEVIIK